MKMHLFGVGGCGTVQVKLVEKLETTFTSSYPMWCSYLLDHQFNQKCYGLMT